MSRPVQNTSRPRGKRLNWDTARKLEQAEVEEAATAPTLRGQLGTLSMIGHLVVAGVPGIGVHAAASRIGKVRNVSHTTGT